MSGGRALVAVEHRRNAELLRDWLGATHGFDVVDELEGARVDLAIVDAAAYARLADGLREARERERPAWLPVLLLVAQRQARGLPPHVWEVADEVLTVPLRSFDLGLRVDRLMALRKRSVALARRLDELGRSNVDLEQFAYVAAHELATPLAVVTGAVETIAALERDRLDPKLRPLLDAAEQESRRLQTLIHDLLAFSQAGRAGPSEPVELDELLDEALAALAPQIDAHGAVVERTPLPAASCDRRQLRLVLTNLVGNAIKYRDAGEPPRIGVSATEDEERVVVSVADNGRGVPADRAQAIFEMFERSDGGRTSGHGIGLALCRRIVERHDGRIWVEPAPGRGSVFRFSLPKPRG